MNGIQVSENEQTNKNRCEEIFFNENLCHIYNKWIYVRIKEARRIFSVIIYWHPRHHYHISLKYSMKIWAKMIWCLLKKLSYTECSYVISFLYVTIMQGKVMRAHAFSILFPFFACAVYLVSCASFNAYSMIHNIFNVGMDMHIASAIQIELPWTSPIESKFCKCNYRNHRIIK